MFMFINKKGERMTSDEKLLMDLAKLKRENPQWFNILYQVSKWPDDKLHEFVEKVMAYLANKETAAC